MSTVFKIFCNWNVDLVPSYGLKLPNMLRFRTYIILFCLVLPGHMVFAKSDSGFGSRIRSVLNSRANKKTLYSIHFCDVADGREVFSFNSQRPQKPASNMKLITTAAAVDLLGPDFVYETVYGLMDGNLVIVAAGDPLLGDPKIAQQTGGTIFDIFDKLAAELRNRGFSTIPGNIIIDNSIFDDERFHPSWPINQANRWFAAQVSGLNFNDNCVDILFSPGPGGAPARFQLTPDTTYLKITNKCRTVSSGKTAVGATRQHHTNKVTLIGKCKTAITKPIYVAVDQPSVYHGYVLAEYLLKQGIRINAGGKLLIEQVRSPDNSLPDDLQVLLTHRTAIDTVLDQCNQRSLNLAAECLLKTAGAYYQAAKQPGGKINNGSWKTGQAAVAAFLKELGIDADQYKIDDGSGLSHNNRISAKCFTTVLRYMSDHKAAKMYRDSLASSDRGTLKKKRRFSGKKYKGRVLAKTGYINSVNTLSGYCKTKSGRHLAFSILTNKPAASNSTIDKIVKEIIDAN